MRLNWKRHQAIVSPASRLTGLGLCLVTLVAFCAVGQAAEDATVAIRPPETMASPADPTDPADTSPDSAQTQASQAQDAPAPASPARVEFNTDFLSPHTRAGIDLSRFERGNPVLPGEYRVELVLNGRVLGRAGITVKPGADPDRGRVCMTRSLLDQVGLNWNRLAPAALKALEDPAACPVLEELTPGGRAEFDTGELRLNLSLPQMALRRTARGYVSPELWDSGVTSGLLSYTVNGYRNDAAGSTTSAAFFGMNAGFNLGRWRVRHSGAGSWQSTDKAGSSGFYQDINTSVERELPSILGRLILGDGNTSGSLFNTQSFRGVQLASDDRMLPDSQRGYAPVVRGIAETNARVTIRQRGIVLYDTPVPPGPFVIDDLYPTGYGGDLDVTITEGDGRVRTFSVPFAAVPQLLRAGSQRYSLTAGTLRNTGLAFTPTLFEATYQRGLTNGLTGYGGIQGNDRYLAAIGGVALGTPLGALSFDLTGARTQLPEGALGGDSTLSGFSSRVGYSKVFEHTGSNINLSAHHYWSSGFLEMADAMRAVDNIERGLTGDLNWRPRNRLSLSFSQPLAEGWGQIYLSGFTQDYWTDRPKDTQLQAGYSNQFRWLSYSISLARTNDPFGGIDNRVMLSLSFPLGSAANAPRLSTNLTHDAAGTAAQTIVTGTAGQNNQFSYGASASVGPGDDAVAGTVNGQYIGTKTTVTAGYGAGHSYSNLSAGLSGSIVVHPLGVTLSPYHSDTVAVIAAAPEAAGARVLGYPNIVLDSGGQAVLPHLTPYRMNEVAIDPNGIPPDVELKTTSQRVAPRAGSIVILPFATVPGRAVLIDASLPNGQTLPFGADVTDGEGNVVGSVGQAGRIYARLPGDEASLTVRWGRAKHEQCAMQVALPPAQRRADPAAGIERLHLACVPGAASAHGETGVTQ